MWAIVCTDRRGRPFFVVDEAGDPATFDTYDEAEACAGDTPVCMALGYEVVEIPTTPPPL